MSTEPGEEPRVRIEVTTEARELVARRGGTIVVDYIGPSG
jgi:hypothetical protein